MIKPAGMSRRDFLLSCALGGAGWAGAFIAGVSPTRRLPASDRIRAAVIGLGRRGGAQLTACLQTPAAEIAALCDVNEAALSVATRRLEGARNRAPLLCTDYRRVLDRQDIDVVVVATPPPWRTAISIAACQAGKDVYVEPPCISSLTESCRLAEAARTTNRLVQQGNDSAFLAASELRALFEGPGFGEIYQVKGWKRLHAAAPAKGNDASPATRVSDWLLNELDFARCMLGVGLPDHVAVVGQFDEQIKRPRPFSCRLRFGQTAEQAQTIELSALPFTTAASAQGVTTTSVLSVQTARGDFSVRSDLTADTRNLARMVHWGNLVDCVRTRQPEGLIAPLDEIQQACELAYLVKAALQSRRSFSFDARAEPALNDMEINDYFREQH